MGGSVGKILPLAAAAVAAYYTGGASLAGEGAVAAGAAEGAGALAGGNLAAFEYPALTAAEAATYGAPSLSGYVSGAAGAAAGAAGSAAGSAAAGEKGATGIAALGKQAAIGAAGSMLASSLLTPDIPKMETPGLPEVTKMPVQDSEAAAAARRRAAAQSIAAKRSVAGGSRSGSILTSLDSGGTTLG